jgi:hypothetical protein
LNEEFEEQGFVAQIERLLGSRREPERTIRLAAGGAPGRRRLIATTVIHFDYEAAGSLREGARHAERTKTVVKTARRKATRAM